MTDTTHDETVDIDAIGVSHRIMVHRVLSSVSTCDNQEVMLSCKTMIKEVINPTQIANTMELDFKDENTELTSLSCEDQMFIAKLKDGIHKDADGHYETLLPFRDSSPCLPNNKAPVFRGLQQKRLQRNPKYHSGYTDFMENMIQRGYAERVPDSNLNKDDDDIWYIPHHGLYHNKKPDKIRVVFDCSAIFKSQSLNQHLLQGPDLTNTFVGVLCQFCKEPIAFICDVEQMFHQFKVDTKHRDFLQFLWWDGGDYDARPTEYRMCVHLYGVVSSPGCANFGLKQAANDNA